jgi:tricorn protease interacting factor F2/3
VKQNVTAPQRMRHHARGQSTVDDAPDCMENAMSEILPLNYRLRLAPDLSRFLFEGQAEIRLRLPQPASEVVLNATELAIWNCGVKRGDNLIPCAFRVEPAVEELHIRLPEAMTGEVLLSIDYTGRINDRMAGFYRSRYLNKGRRRYLAITQFEESDARRAFPCIDHPGRKATFDIEMVVGRSMAAVANTDINAQEMLKGGKKRVIFETTPRMSTYLVFFGVGEFETLQDPIDGRVRVLTLPPSQKHARFGLEFGRKALAFSESYYGIPYPLAKLDLIAVPDFAFGAMENWGAITFRENLLLHHPGITSKAGEERICEVIAHEIAHQWFGNLVTPSDWKYLWLNESFATYFGYGVVAHYFPDWGIWQQFLQSTTATAMNRDALLENVAIEIPGGEHLVINTSTAPIIYNKGGSILRQVEGYIGPAYFRKGLQHYLQTHAYQSAESRHLWEAFEAVSDRPVTALMRNWVEQPGLPLVTVAREPDALVLSQRRFTYLPNDFGQTWLIPLNLRVFTADGESRGSSFLMDSAEMRIPIDQAAVAFKLNDGQTGYYRVKYADSENTRRLGEMVRQKALSPEDRWGLQSDLYALTVAGDVRLDDYVAFTEHYRKEDDYLPLAGIAANLFHARLTAGPETAARIAASAGPWFGEVLDRIGYAPRADEAHTTAILRDQILFDAVQYGCREAEAFALERFEELRQGRTVHPDILRSILQTGAWNGDGRILNWFERRFQKCESEHERMILLAALGSFRKPAEIEKVLDDVLTTVPPRNKFIPVVALAANPLAASILWSWYVGRLPQIEQFHPMLYERVIAAIVPAAGLERPDEVRGFFAEYIQKNGKARDVIRLSLERMEINCRMRRRCGP